jgi:hypothetical protein
MLRFMNTTSMLFAVAVDVSSLSSAYAGVASYTDGLSRHHDAAAAASGCLLVRDAASGQDVKMEAHTANGIRIRAVLNRADQRGLRIARRGGES